jgi:hypothetical protein
MRKIIRLACAVILMGLPVFAQSTGSSGPAAPASTAPEHPVTVAQVQEMLQLSGYANMKKQMIGTMLPYLKQAMPFLPADVVDDFQARMEKADFESVIVKSYQSHLSTEDASAIIAFYKTPAGRRMISQMPLIVRETQQAGAELGQKTMSEVLSAHKAEVEDAARKYQESGTTPQR